MGNRAKMRFDQNFRTGGSYWHKVNVSELHFARSFQGYPTWPYLECTNTCPNTPRFGKSIWALEGFGQSLFASGNYFYKKDFDGPFHTNVFFWTGWARTVQSWWWWSRSTMVETWWECCTTTGDLVSMYCCYGDLVRAWALGASFVCHSSLVLANVPKLRGTPNLIWPPSICHRPRYCSPLQQRPTPPKSQFGQNGSLKPHTDPPDPILHDIPVERVFRRWWRQLALVTSGTEVKRTLNQDPTPTSN